MKDLFETSHVKAAIYFTDQGAYLFRYKAADGLVVKNLREGDVRAAFAQAAEDSGWLSDGILRVGNTPSGPWFIQYSPEQRVSIKLAQEGELCIPIPALIWAAHDGIYHVFALSGEFSPDAMLYTAPFPNVYEDAAVCWGNNDRLKVSAEIMPKVVDLFWSAPFSNHLAGKKCKSHPDDVRILLRSLAGADKFPAGELISTRQSLESYVNSIIRGSVNS